MNQERRIAGTNSVSIEHVKKLTDRLPYTRIQIPEIIMDGVVQWQDVIPESYGEDQEGRFFLVTKVVTNIVTTQNTEEGIKSINDPVCLCLFQRFPDKEDFVEFTSNTTGIFFLLSADSFKEIADMLDKQKGHIVDTYT